MSDASQPPICPDCSQPMGGVAMALVEREDDGKRTCRAVWECANRHMWWNWADRPRLPLERCPMPEAFRPEPQ